MIQLQEQLGAVIDEKTFLAFVQPLAADRRLDAERRESLSIDEFLEAAMSWAEDSEFGARQDRCPHHPGRSLLPSFTAGRVTNSEQ